MAKAQKVTRRKVTPAQRVLDDKVQRQRELQRHIRLNQRIAALTRSLRGSERRVEASRLELLHTLALDVDCEVMDRQRYTALVDERDELRMRAAELQRQLGDALDRIVSATT